MCCPWRIGQVAEGGALGDVELVGDLGHRARASPAQQVDELDHARGLGHLPPNRTSARSARSSDKNLRAAHPCRESVSSPP